MKARIIPTLILGTAIAGLAQSPPPPTGKKAASAFGAAAKPGISIVKQPDGTAFIADAPKFNPGDTSADVRIIKRQDGTLSIEDVNKGSRATASPKAATGSTLTLVFTKDAEPGTSQRLTVTDAADPSKPFQGGYHPTPGGPSVAADPAAAAMITRTYALAAAGKAPADDAEARKARIQRQTELKNFVAEAIRVAGLSAKEPELTWIEDGNALIVKATAAQHDLIADALSARERKPAPAASPRPAAASPTGGALITRLYSLKALITKAPAKIDDDAHNKRAADAYQAKVEALLGWVKTVLAHSEPAEASFAFSPEAGAFVVKATEAQHDALMQGVAIFEDNYGK